MEIEHVKLILEPRDLKPASGEGFFDVDVAAGKIRNERLVLAVDPADDRDMSFELGGPKRPKSVEIRSWGRR